MITQSEFKPLFKRIIRQLDERLRKVMLNQKPEAYYQNKRKEFVALIDKATASGWFTKPERGTRLYNIYHEV